MFAVKLDRLHGDGQFFGEGFGAVAVQHQLDHLGFPVGQQAAAEGVQRRMQLSAQVHPRQFRAGVDPVLLAEQVNSGPDVCQKLQVTLAERGARLAFAQGDIEDALRAYRDQVAALVLVAAVEVPGLVVIAALEVLGGEIAQSEHAESPLPGRGKIERVEQERALDVDIEG